MGYDDEIKDLLDRSKSKFLPDLFQDPETRVNVYSLEEEFKKASKNRNFVFYSLVGLFVVVLAVAALVFTTILQKEGKELKIDISSFEDSKLLELIGATKKDRINLDKVKRDLLDLKLEFDDELASVEEDYSRQHDNIMSTDHSDEERAELLKNNEAKKNAALQAVKYKYSGKISSKENEIKGIQQKISETEGKIGNSTLKAVLGSQDELNELQNEKLRQYYENKMDRLNQKVKKEKDELIALYNPTFSEKELNAVLESFAKKATIPNPLLDGIENDVINEKATSKKNIGKIRASVQKEIELMARLQKVPYMNSVPKALYHSDSYSKTSIRLYDEMVQALVYSIKKKNERLNNLDYALSSMINKENENGYIIDSRNSKKIAVFLNKSFFIKPGDTAYVFRTDEEYIASIKFYKIDDSVFATVVETAPGKKIIPFDKILLKMK